MRIAVVVAVILAVVAIVAAVIVLIVVVVVVAVLVIVIVVMIVIVVVVFSSVIWIILVVVMLAIIPLNLPISVILVVIAGVEAIICALFGWPVDESLNYFLSEDRLLYDFLHNLLHLDFFYHLFDHCDGHFFMFYSFHKNRLNFSVCFLAHLFQLLDHFVRIFRLHDPHHFCEQAF